MMTRKTHALPAIALLCVSATSAFSQANASANFDPNAAELEALRDTVARAPYAALVAHTKVEVKPIATKSSTADKSVAQGVAVDPGAERHVYHARVIETFKGKAYKKIRYEMIVEKGEETSLDRKPKIVALCAGKDGFYWPGVGTSFSSQPKFREAARRVGKLPTKREPGSATLCE
jgi:hypothetical protein